MTRNRPIRTRYVLAAGLVAALAVLGGGRLGAAETTLRIAGPAELLSSGLMEPLLRAWREADGEPVDLEALATGAVLREEVAEAVDLLLAHAPGEERQSFLAGGLGTDAGVFLTSRYVLVGPDADPAMIRFERSVRRALPKLTRAHKPFLSRGDRSGAHGDEVYLWLLSGLLLQERSYQVETKGGDPLPARALAPPGNWYRLLGRSARELLRKADGEGAYAVVDLATWQRARAAGEASSMRIILVDDPLLADPYHVYLSASSSRPDAARRFADWLASPAAGEAIDAFELGGERVFQTPGDE
jgi:tungstate transport system substrate-binding protein